MSAMSILKDGRYRLLIRVGVLLALLDQAVKWAVLWHFDAVEGSRQKVIPGLFDLIFTRNPGAAWSMLADLEPDGLRVALFIVLSLLAVVFIFYYASKATPAQRLFLWGLAFVLGGALGNLVDRVAEGSVVDYLEFYSRAAWLVEALGCSKYWGCRFPAFNVADIAINVGVGLLILDAVLSMFRKTPAPTQDGITITTDPTGTPPTSPEQQEAAPLPPASTDPLPSSDGGS